MKKINSGEIWTVADHKNHDMSVFVLTINKNDSCWIVVPVHEHLFLRTEIDPLIEIYSEKLNESFEAVAVVHNAMEIPEKAFSIAKACFGKISDDSMIKVKERISEYFTATSKLSEIQLKEARSSDFEEADNDISPITSGIFELCPVEGCDLDELVAFNEEALKILQPWHVLAMAESFASEEEKQASEVAEKKGSYE